MRRPPFAALVPAVLALCFASFAAAAPPLPDDLPDGDPGVVVLSAAPERTVLRFETGRFALRDVDVDGTPYVAIDWEGGADRQDRGAPALPGFRASVAIPDDARMELRVLSAEHVDVAGVRVAPSKGAFTRDILPRDVPWEIGPVYAGSGWTPAEIAGLGAPYVMRDVRGAVVTVEPFQWDPATSTLRVWTSVEVEIVATGPGEVNVLTSRPQAPVDEFERIYARHFLNWSGVRRYAPVGEAGNMLVVAYDSFMDAVQPFVDWKNRMGMPTRMVAMSEIGTTASQLKAYVQAAYDTEGVCFILLVGDGPQIPYFTNGGGAADPMLTLLAGSDSYPDAFVGRISAQTVGEVATQVERVVAYENAPDLAGDWYARGVAIASNEGAGIGDDGEADWQHARNYRADLLGFTYTLVNELYDGTHPGGGDPWGTGGGGSDADGNPSDADLSALLNAGRGLVHYTGHGSATSWVTTGFNNTDINNLTNVGMLPFVVSVGCVNGQFMSGTCFAETWMRATSGGEPTGAVACYASTVNQQWATPMKAQDEMIDLMCAGEKSTWGGLCFNGSCAMIDRYGSNGISEFKNWTIFGDPSLRVRTAVPHAIATSHAGFVDPSLGVFTITTEPGALVGLSDGVTCLGSAFADGSGIANIVLDPADFAGRVDVLLTVTAFNGIPSEETVPVNGGSTAAPLVAAAVGLGPAAPNPFTSGTSLALTLTRETAVRLEILDVAGRRIRTISGERYPAGSHRIAWDGKDTDGRPVPAGTYFARLVAGDRVETQRVVRLR